MHHERPVSLYVTVPASDLTRVRPLVRLLINQIGRRLTERMDFEEGRHTPRYRHRLLLMLDEFASLGRLDFFQTQLSYRPGYGIKAFLIVQDLSQLYAAYGRDESIISNCDIRVAYAPNKVETAPCGAARRRASVCVARELASVRAPGRWADLRRCRREAARPRQPARSALSTRARARRNRAPCAGL